MLGQYKSLTHGLTILKKIYHFDPKLNISPLHPTVGIWFYGITIASNSRHLVRVDPNKPIGFKFKNRSVFILVWVEPKPNSKIDLLSL